MKITKFIDFSQEVDIELDSEDIRLILSEGRKNEKSSYPIHIYCNICG